MARIYIFKKDNIETRVGVMNGGYLTAEEIKSYEETLGSLYSVTYNGKTILANEGEE